MDLITINLKLKVVYKDTQKTEILPLPRNENIFELLGKKCNELYIVDKNGKARLAEAFITAVNANDKELV